VTDVTDRTDSRDEPITVAICDDHRVLAEGLAAVLAGEPGIKVVGIAGSVAEAVEQAERCRPAVILMDYQLPDGDGVAATKTLKQAHPEVMVVMLTSYTDEQVLVAAMEAGCSGYITKHDGAKVVADGVRMAASGEVLVSASMLQVLLPRLGRTSGSVGSDLTSREREILELFADGSSTEDIAKQLFLSTNTVRNHAQGILSKLSVHSRLEAVAVAVREGIIRRF
jgi:DNA-binding NarL/FixJ family response regulator